MQLSVEKGVVFYISQLIQSATEQVDLSQSNSCILETSWSKHQMKMGELSQQYFLPSLKNSRPSKKKRQISLNWSTGLSQAINSSAGPPVATAASNSVQIQHRDEHSTTTWSKWLTTDGTEKDHYIKHDREKALNFCYTNT